MAGRIRSFTDEEIEVLREVARKLRAERDWSGRELGEALGIAQQNAGRFVAAGSTAGMDRVTANRLAILAGFRDVEHLLLDAGVFAEMKAVRTGSAWHDRDVAMRVARTLGYSEDVIQSVMHRYSEHAYTNKVMRWWNDQIVLESMARAADPGPQPAPTKSMVVEKRRRPRKKTGTEG